MVQVVNVRCYILLNRIHTPLVYCLGVRLPVCGRATGAGFCTLGDCLTPVGVLCTPAAALACCGPIDFKYAINCNNCSSLTNPWKVGIIDGRAKPLTTFA